MSLALIEKGKTKKNPMVKLSIKRKTHISINTHNQLRNEKQKRILNLSEWPTAKKKIRIFHT